MSFEHDVKEIELDELNDSSLSEMPMFTNNIELVKNVKVKLSVMLGGSELTVDELFNLKSGSIVKLDKLLSAPISVQLEGNIIAKGTLVAVDDNFGIKITDIKTT